VVRMPTAIATVTQLSVAQARRGDTRGLQGQGITAQ
jgi:hypothetical protein